MLYQTPSGTINVDDNMYFSMTDEQWEKYLMYRRGADINDPFHQSVLDGDLLDELLDDEEAQQMLKDLPDLNPDPSEFLSEE